MSVKKAFSLLTVLSVVSGMLVMPGSIYAKGISFPVIYDFENGMSGWEMGATSKDAGLEKMPENDNHFLRLTAKSGEIYRLQDNIDAVPNAFVQLDAPYVMEADSEIIVSADVRTNETKLIRNLMINRDRLNEEVNKEVQYNFATLWNWDKNNKISTFELTQTTSVGGYKKAKSNTAYSSLENDKWYEFAVILYTDSNGFPEELELKVSDNGTLVFATGKRMIENETLRLANKITRIDFDLANAAVTLAEDAVLDFDNIRIYQNTDERYCSIRSQNAGNVFKSGEKIVLAFNGPMDPDSINDTNIELYGPDGNKLLYDGVYNAGMWEYTVSPKGTPADGEYKVRLKKDDIKGIKQDGGVIEGLSAECESELSFVIFSRKLPEVRDFSISGKNLKGQTISASGSFFSQSGINGHLEYQWFCSDSETGDYEKIDGKTGSSFSVPDGFSDKYIRASAVPVSNDGLVRGEEVFSNIISPPSKPVVKNNIITGELKEGESLIAEGEYFQEDGLSGSIGYQWWYSKSENGAYSKIENAREKSFLVTGDYADKYIRVSLTPKTDDGTLTGEEMFSDVLSPMSKPFARDVTISGPAITQMTLTLDYTFVDENGDREGKSKFEWLISPDGVNNWTVIGEETSKDYVIPEEDAGKYIRARVTPVSEEEPKNGNSVLSNTIGPIKNIESINLVSNPGFEEGSNTGWNVRNMGGDSATVTAIKEDRYSGEWCGRFEGQTVNSTYMVYGVDLKADTRYIEACMMKVAEDSAKDNAEIVFYGEGNPETSYRYSDQNIIKKSDWSLVSQLVSLKTDGRFSQMPQYWAGGTPGYIAYIDDFYIAPLLVYDIKAKVPESITIPSSGETSENLALLAVTNQIGTTLGLENEAAYWEVDDGVKGVYIKDGKLYVTSNARSGTLKLKAVCEPSFDGAVQKRFVKVYTTELISNGNKTPRINSAELSGNTSGNSVIKLDYDFYQADNLNDASIIKWYVSDSLDGVYEDAGRTGLSFDITDEFKDKYIKAQITPVDSDGSQGQTVTTNIVGPKMPPCALDVKITGKGYVGDTLKSEYTYYDFNSDEEGNTKFQWLRSDSPDGEYIKINGATGPEYTVSNEDADHYIKLSVKPFAVKGPYEGEEALSNALMGPKAPYIRSVSVSRMGNVLVGKYTYVSDNGTEEGNTLCQWLIDGVVVGTGTRFEPKLNASASIEFRVTPVAVSEPKTGESISAFQTFTVSSSSPKGSGGGGGGGSAAAASWVLDKVIPENTSEQQTFLIPDILEHWSREYAQKAVEKGIMRLNKNSMFEPERYVTRAETVEYIFKVMGYTETEYRGEFKDVTADMSYANYLQTLVDKGIISKDEKFRPDDNVSRQEACKIISIALGLSYNDSVLDKYIDRDEIGAWATDYVNNMIKAGIMVGISSDCFSPKTNITNAQMAKILVVISAEYINK